MTEREEEVCFYWTASGSNKCSLNFTGESFSLKEFNRLQAQRSLSWKLTENMSYCSCAMDIKRSPVHDSTINNFFPATVNSFDETSDHLKFSVLYCWAACWWHLMSSGTLRVEKITKWTSFMWTGTRKSWYICCETIPNSSITGSY